MSLLKRIKDLFWDRGDEPDADLDAGPDADLDAGPDADLDAGPDADPNADPNVDPRTASDSGPRAGPDAISDPNAGPDVPRNGAPGADRHVGRGAAPPAANAGLSVRPSPSDPEPRSDQDPERRLAALVKATRDTAAPPDSRLVVTLASELAAQGRARRAVELLRRLTACLPSRGSVDMCLAELLRDLRNFDAAVELLQQLTEVPGQRARAHFLLGDYHGAEGNHSTALNHYEAVLALDFLYPRARARADALRRKLDRPVAIAAPTIFGAEDLGPAGRFTLQRELGRGGGGTVYLAQDQALGRPLAVKVLHPHVARHQEARAHLFCEARIAAALRHPRIVTIYDLIESLNLIVMEYCSGGALADLIASAPLPPVAALQRLAEITRVLDTVHRCGVVHRDLKPGNLLLRGNSVDGALVLTDFGTAHAPSERLEADSQHMPEGSLIYMAPEQRRGAPVDPRADLYACGVILLEMLRGHPPLSHQQAIAGTTVLEVADLWQDLADQVPAPLCALCRELVSPAADDRPASAQHLARRADQLRADLEQRLLQQEALAQARRQS